MALAFSPVVAAQTNAHSAAAPAGAHGVEVGMPILESHSYKEIGGYGQIWTIAQDHSGLIYLGQSGTEMIEYDGVSWRKINIGMDIVRSLAVDDQNRVWAGGNGGFGYLEPDASGALRYVSLLEHIPTKERDFTDVWQTIVTPRGMFFRSFEKLFRWDGKTMHIWRVREGSRFEGLSMVRGRIYTSENGVGLEEIVGDELRPLPGGAAFAKSRKLFLHPYDDGRIVISERDGLLSIYDGQKVTPFTTTADDYLKAHKVYTSTLLRDGDLCVTTLDGGAVIVDHDGKLRQVINVSDGLLDPGVLSAFQDRDGALWLGTSAGMSRVEIGSPISIFSRDGPLDAIRYKGSVYTANGGGTAAVFKLVSDPRTHRPSMVPIGGGNQGFQFQMFKDPSGKTPDQLLIATSEGILRVDGDKLVPALPALHSLDNQAYAVLQSRKDRSRVFIGHGDGVASMRWDGTKWIDEGRLPNTIYVAHSLAEDSDGDLWVGGGKGHLLRIKVAPTGMRDSTAEAAATNYGFPAANGGVAYLLGDVYAALSPGRTSIAGIARRRNLCWTIAFNSPSDAPGAVAPGL